MAFKYTGDATLGVSLTVQTPKPLDTRTVVNSIEDLYTIPEKYAYQGMTVANVGNGNLYMLVDKAKITEKAGWKASYESIQIITCTDAEYQEWAANTTDDFKPIDEQKSYLHEDTYYYIYEDSISEDQQYLSASWGKQIEEQLKQKALNTTVVELQKKVESDISNLKDNYLTAEQIAEKYALQESLNKDNPESLISEILSDYYNRKEVDDTFVTKESLRGEGIEGDDFVFVTQSQYEKDKEQIQRELDKTIKTDEDGQLDSITVGQIKSPVIEEGEQLTVDVKEDGLYVGADKFAMLSDVPNLITLSETEYNKLLEEGKIQEDTYYYIYDITNENLVYVTKEYLESTYSTKNEYQSWVAQNYYSRTKIDEIVSGLQTKGSYVTTEDIKQYYTKTETNDTFLKKEDAQNTYATNTELNQFKETVASEYVTKESLRGDTPSGGEDDFIFVTQSKYEQDKVANKQQFQTKNLVTENITIQETKIEQEEEVIENEVKLSVSNGQLTVNDKVIAYEQNVPKLICLPQSEYEDLVESNETQQDTYYCTYGEDQEDTGYVSSDYLTKNYYTKKEVEDLLKALESRIQKLENGGTSGSAIVSGEQLTFG